MKDLKEALGGFSLGGPGSLFKNLGSLGVLGDKVMDSFNGGGRKEGKKSNKDEAIEKEMERHKESHKQRSEHGKY